MKKLFLFLLTVVLSVSALAQTRKVAILETVDRQNQITYGVKLMLRSYLAEAVTNTKGYEAGIKKAQESTKKFSTSISKVIQGLGKNGLVGALGSIGLASAGLSATLGAVVKIAKQVSQAIGECTDAYKKQLIAERQLETAINNNPLVTGSAKRRLTEFASEMQKVSNYGDEELIPMMANLVSLGRTEEETMKIMAVAMDMSASGSMSLDTAITQLNATLNGNIGKLGQQNAELKGLTDEELKSGKAIDILGEKFKGLSQATIDTSKQLQNIKGDFKEAIGQFTLPTSDMWNKFWMGFYEKGISVIKKFDEYLDKTIIGKDIALTLESELKKISDSRERLLLIEDTIHPLSDQQLNALKEYLEDLRVLTAEQKEMRRIGLETINDEIESRVYLSKLYADMDKEEAERQENLEEQKQLEDDIVKLKEEYLKKVAEQEAKWENIKLVTGEEVKAEEKLKFYQDALVDVMTQAGGKITTNNQLYKDQIKIINALKESLVVVEEVIEETSEQVEEDTEQYKTLFQLIEEGFQKALEKQRQMTEDWSSFADNTLTTLINSFSDMFILIGQSLVDDSVGFKDFASVAIKSIQEILKGLSAQLTALATINFVTGQYANAMKATAGATMALVASGTLGGVAKRMKEVSSATEEANGSLEQFKANLDAIYSGEYSKKSGTFFAGISAVQREINALRKEADEVYKIASQPYEMVQTAYGKVKTTGRKNREIDRAKKEYEELIGAITDATQEMVASIKEFAKQSKEVVDANKTTIESYKDYYSAIRLFNAYSELTIDDADKLEYALIASGTAIGDITTTMTYKLEKYKVLSETLLNEIKANAQSLAISFYESFSNIGKNIGEMIFNNILDGAGETSFLENLKTYIRKNMLQILIYTEGFAEQLSEVGGKLMSALMGNRSATVMASELEEAKQELVNLYESVAEKAKKVDDIMSMVFDDIDDTISDSVDESIKKLTEFEQAMADLLESIQDLGGDIASQIAQGLTDGLSQSDFLDNMKNWLRNMMIQMVVYTDTMKVEVEEIGKRISKGLIDGFTQTDLHEIRRDLSYLFEQASSKVATIDSMLGSVFAYADGTNNASRGIALVGEAGPELVKFNGGEQVLNNRNTQKLIADKNNTASTFNVNFYQTRDTTAFAMMSQLKQYQRQMVFNGVL